MNGAITRYSRTMIALHWATVALVVTAYFLSEGERFVRLRPPQLHFAFGLGVLLLVVPRLIARALGCAPAMHDYGLLTLAAKAGHGVLYGLLIAVPLTGWYAASRLGVRISFLGFSVPSLAQAVNGSAGWIGKVHQVGGNLILVLAGLHAAMALWHQFVMRDGTLSRMSPW